MAALFPKLAIAISYAAAEVALGEARAIALAVAAVVPDQPDLIFAAAAPHPTAIRTSARWASARQNINPANFVGGDRRLPHLLLR